MRLLRTLAVVLIAALATIGVALAATPSPRARRAATAQNTITGGVLAQTNSRDGSAILTAARMRPGDRAQGTVTITNSGDLEGAFTLATAALADAPGPNGGRLSGRLQLDVSDITQPGAPAAVGSSPLGAMPVRDLGTFAAGEARTYLFVVTFPDGGLPASGTTGDNAYLGSTARVRFDWTSRSDATTPTGPPIITPGPTPALTLAVTPRTRISLRRTKLTTRCSRACTVTVGGSVVSVRGVSKRVLARVRARRYVVRAGVPRKIAIKLQPKVRRAIKLALRQHRVVTLRLKVVARGPATAPGAVTRTLRIRIRP